MNLFKYLRNLYNKEVYVTTKIYKKFVDTGEVPEDIIELLCNKMRQGIPFTALEFCIAYGKADIINSRLINS